MKRFFLTLACFLIAGYLQVYAGSDRKISISVSDMTIGHVLEKLNKEYSYNFIMETSDVDIERKVSVDLRNVELGKVLDIILDGSKVVYEISGNTVQISTKKVTVRHSETVSGVVTEKENGLPAVGVAVMIKGTSSGDVTDSDGHYSIAVSSGDILVFSSIGFKTVEIPVGGKSVINVALDADMLAIEETVVVGYGTQARKTLTTSISKIGEDKLYGVPVNSVGDALKGKVAGLRVATNNTLAGGAPRMLIRGGSSINLSNDPIVIVDGVTRTMHDINPNDIESIEVLKDAASAGIYGARASNGVILVTTKKGKASKGPQIVFDSQLGFQTPARKWDLMNSREFISFVRPAIAEGPNAEAILNGANAAGVGNKPTDIHTTAYLDEGEPVPAGYQWMYDPVNPEKVIIFTDTDYQSQWFRNSFWHKQYVGVNGGNDAIKYAASVSYMGDNGIVAMNDMDVFTLHGNTSFKIVKNLEASTTFDVTRMNVNATVDNLFNSIGRGILMGPTHRNYFEDGTLVTGGTNKNCQTAEFYEKFYDRERITTRINGNFNLKWKIIDGLTANAQYVIFSDYYDAHYYAHGEVGGTPNYVSTTRSTTETATHTTRNSFQAYLNYTKTFAGDHNFTATAGYDYMHQRYTYLTASSTGSNSDKVPVLGSGIEFTADNKDESQSLISYFGRVNYDYKQRYILSATFRADGSSKFAKGNQWGYFPAGSAAWLISEEPFFSKAKDVMNTMKLRVSYGQTGNNGIGLYDTYGSFASGMYAGQNMYLPSSMVNTGMKWETTTQLDVGLDMSFLKDRIRIVADYYNKVTDNMLFSITLPDTGQFGSVISNVGAARFYGFEIELNTVNIQTKNFTWTTGITYSYNKNRVLKLPDEYRYTDINGKDAWRIGGYTMSRSGYRFGGTAVGEELGRIYGYKISHIIETEAQADAALFDTQGKGYRRSDGLSIAGRKDVGDYEFCNREGSALSADGKEQIDAEDMFELGNVMPHSIGGISNVFYWKNFTFSIYFDYALGHSIYNYMKSRFFQNTMGNSNSNLDKMVYDCWTHPGDDAKYARFFPNDADFGNRNFSRASDFNVERADYLCLRDVSVYYKLPAKWFRKIGLKDVTVGVSGNTLCYITGVSGTVTPESGMGTGSGDSQYVSVNNGSSNGNFTPASRKFLFNIKLTF